MIWISANKFGFELLKEAKKIVDIKAIITLKDNATTVMYDGIEKKKWHNLGIPVYEIENINQEIPLLNFLNPDYIIVCGWRQKIGSDVVTQFKDRIIAFHPTLLPFGRGASPIINTILQGIKNTGVSMYYLSYGIDDGDILAQEYFSVEETDHASEVYNKVIIAGKKLIKKYLLLAKTGGLPRTPQNISKIVVFDKVKLSDNEIDFKNESVPTIQKKIRAFSKPYNGAYFKINGKRTIIWRVEKEC